MIPASRSIPATRVISISALNPMKTAARPTSECIAATSCGISVICTRCATFQPAAPPSPSNTSATNQLPDPSPSIVATMASAMPAMPYQTARLALSCPDRPPSDRMNRIAATT
jgi:hypothetical protein